MPEMAFIDAVYSLWCGLVLLNSSFASTEIKAPNIVFILADDLGWTDVSFHGYHEIPTPNIDRLAAEGVILQDYYAQYLCTPSRVALMTGKYPIRTAMQRLVLQIGEARGLSLEEKILPEYLKDLGYATHIVGKWHLGYAHPKMTPLHRGFDTFFGYYAGSNDYFNYTHEALKKEWSGFDLWNNVTDCRDFKGRYSTNLFTDVAIKRINEHQFCKGPLFLYMSHMAPHAANRYDPTEAPWKDEKRFAYIKHNDRREHAAMVNILDESVGKVFGALEKKGVLDNTIIVFSSDNGGTGREQVPFFGVPEGFGSNWPLKGAKGSQWEGGVRVTGLVWSPLIKRPRRIMRGLMHISDWLPTFYRLGGGRRDIPDLDGMDIWDAISTGTPSPRHEILHQIDPVGPEYAIRWKQYKLVYGSPGGLKQKSYRIDTWYEPPNGLHRKYIRGGRAAIRCRKPSNAHPCNATAAPCLFDIEADPCEYNNIANSHKDVSDLLMAKLRAYNTTALPSNPDIFDLDPRAKTKFHDGLIKPFLSQTLAYEIPDTCTPKISSSICKFAI